MYVCSYLASPQESRFKFQARMPVSAWSNGRFTWEQGVEDATKEQAQQAKQARTTHQVVPSPPGIIWRYQSSLIYLPLGLSGKVR